MAAGAPEMIIGLVAGRGELPALVARGARASGHPVHVVQLEGFGSTSRFDAPAMTFPLGSFGGYTRWMREAGVTHVCLAGQVERPDFGELRPDLKGLKVLPSLIKAARDGDDALLQALLRAMQSEGFEVLAPQDVAASLLAPSGQFGAIASAPTGQARADVIKACEIAREMGRLDIGQACVVSDGLVLAVEAQEGTSAMLRRVAELPEAIRGTPASRRGILAKTVKPGQDTRVDLPTIGPETVELADRAGLAGIVVEAGQAFVIDRDAVVAHADRAGIFLLGLPPG